MIIVDENKLTYGTLYSILVEAFEDEMVKEEGMKLKYNEDWLRLICFY